LEGWKFLGLEKGAEGIHFFFLI